MAIPPQKLTKSARLSKLRLSQNLIIYKTERLNIRQHKKYPQFCEPMYRVWNIVECIEMRRRSNLLSHLHFIKKYGILSQINLRYRYQPCSFPLSFLAVQRKEITRGSVEQKSGGWGGSDGFHPANLLSLQDLASWAFRKIPPFIKLTGITSGSIKNTHNFANRCIEYGT